MIGDGPVGHALYHSAMVWIQYIAIEPYLRRVRPASLVSWARMVSRRWRDPILGRDVLAGLFLGGAMVAAQLAAGRILLSTDGQLSFRDTLGPGPVPVAYFTDIRCQWCRIMTPLLRARISTGRQHPAWLY